MPWGSWVTCEETVNGPDVGPDFTGASNVPLTKPHGFVFEVPVSVFPGDGQSTREPIRVGRTLRPRGGVLRPAQRLPLPHRGRLRLRVRLLPLQAAERPDGRRPARGRRDAGDAQGRRRRQRPPRGARRSRARPTRSSGCRSRTRRPSSPTPPARPRPPPTTRRSPTSRARAGRRARRTSPGSRARSPATASSTSPPPRAAARPRRPTPTRRGYGRGSGQVWAYHTASRKLRCVFQSSGPMELDLPDNITTSKRGTLVVCEDSSGDNYIRGLSKNGKLWDIALNRLRSSTGGDRSGDEFAGSTFSPGGKTLFVNIQAEPGHVVRDLGAVAQDRGLIRRDVRVRAGTAVTSPVRRVPRPGCRARGRPRPSDGHR